MTMTNGMHNKLIEFLWKKSAWFKMPIADLEWFLEMSEREIRHAIHDMKLLAIPKPRFPTNDLLNHGNVVHFYTYTPYALYRDEIVRLSLGLGKSKLPMIKDFDQRILDAQAKIPGLDEVLEERGWKK